MGPDGKTRNQSSPGATIINLTETIQTYSSLLLRIKLIEKIGIKNTLKSLCQVRDASLTQRHDLAQIKKYEVFAKKHQITP